MINHIVMLVYTGAPCVPIPIPIFNSPRTVTLEWDIPFSWPDYPICHYDVNVTNHPELVREAINETSVQFTAEEHHQECEEIEFKVRASNNLASSKYGIITTGFPIGTICNCTPIYIY